VTGGSVKGFAGHCEKKYKIYNMKEGDTMVELDQFKYTLSTFEKPLVEVRDSL
jgi:hypothetical protein